MFGELPVLSNTVLIITVCVKVAKTVDMWMQVISLTVDQGTSLYDNQFLGRIGEKFKQTL